MKFIITAIRERQHARFYIYKEKKLRNVFIYKNPDTLQKSRQFLLRSFIQKTRQFTLHYFYDIFEVGIYIQKEQHFALRDF